MTTRSTSVCADLPIADRAGDIARAVAAHAVTLVVGATGSGKSTQLPKICLEAGRGAGAMIGHTQPRRIAARSIAARIASELGAGLGRQVGYQVRFQRHTARDTRIKLMTDGILLAEIQGDRDLRAYDTLIIDEAHERTLNVDFVLGYLRELAPRRPDLRVVVASATLEVEKLRAFFRDAPVIEVEGRTHPIEIRYRPGAQGDDTPEKVAGRWRSCATSRATCSCSCPGSGRFGRPRPGCGASGWRIPSSSRSMPACRRRASRRCSRPPAAAAWCSRQMSRRPR